MGKKNNFTKVKPTIKTNQSNVNSPLIINKDNENHFFDEPFSHNMHASDKVLDKVINNRNFDQLLDSDVVTDVKREVEKCASMARSSISGADQAMHRSIDVTEIMLQKTSLLINKTIEQNMDLGQDLLKCNDAKDMLKFQQKFFEVNVMNSFNFFMEIGQLLQDFTLKNMKIVEDSVNNNVKQTLHN